MYQTSETVAGVRLCTLGFAKAMSTVPILSASPTISYRLSKTCPYRPVVHVGVKQDLILEHIQNCGQSLLSKALRGCNMEQQHSANVQ